MARLIYSRIEIANYSLVILMLLLKTTHNKAIVYGMLMRTWINNGIRV